MTEQENSVEIELSLSSKEADYLWASVIEFYHKLNNAREGEKLVVDLDERVLVARSLWKKIEDILGKQ